MLKLNPTLKGWIPAHTRLQAYEPNLHLWRYRDSDEQYHYFLNPQTGATQSVDVQVGDFDIDWDIYNGFKPRPPESF